MHRFSVVATVALVALVAAGCGSSKKSSSTTSSTNSVQTPATTTSAPSANGGGGASLKLSADPSGGLKFTVSSLSAKAGKVTLTMANPASVPHAIAVEGNGIDKDGKTVGQGGTSTVSVSLKPGKYTFYCPVDGHKQAGMKGTLTVK